MHFFINAAIKSIAETQKFGDKFQKREFIVETDEQYPETLKFEFINDQVDVLDTFILGEMVTIAFIPRGNEFNGKYYVQLRAIAISGIADGFVDKEFKKSKVKNKKTQQLVEAIKKAHSLI